MLTPTEVAVRVQEAEEHAKLICDSEYAAKIAELEAKHAAEKIEMSIKFDRLRTKMEADHRRELDAAQQKLSRYRKGCINKFYENVRAFRLQHQAIFEKMLKKSTKISELSTYENVLEGLHWGFTLYVSQNRSTCSVSFSYKTALEQTSKVKKELLDDTNADSIQGNWAAREDALRTELQSQHRVDLAQKDAEVVWLQADLQAKGQRYVPYLPISNQENKQKNYGKTDKFFFSKTHCLAFCVQNRRTHDGESRPREGEDPASVQLREGAPGCTRLPPAGHHDGAATCRSTTRYVAETTCS